MALDVTYGNMTEAEAERLAQATGAIDTVEHEPGCTEPWISRLVADFVVARGARCVLETGCFKGATTAVIVEALERLGGGEVWFCDVDVTRTRATMDRILPLVTDHDRVRGYAVTADILGWLANTPERFDLAWVDDNHEKKHVRKELQLLYPKMNPGGLILLHDVYGVCDLQSVVREFGGYSLDLPRLGPAGGIGIIQVPS